MATLDKKIKDIQDRYTTLVAQAQKGGFSIDPLDPLAVKCSVGDSCCAGGDKSAIENRIRTEHEIRIAEEVRSLRGQYASLVAKVTAENELSPQVMDLNDSCACGDACHTGSTDKLNSLLDEVSLETSRLRAARSDQISEKETQDLRTRYDSLAKKIGEIGETMLDSIDLVGYTCHGGEHCHGGSNRQLDRLSLISAAAKVSV